MRYLQDLRALRLVFRDGYQTVDPNQHDWCIEGGDVSVGLYLTRWHIYHLENRSSHAIAGKIHLVQASVVELEDRFLERAGSRPSNPLK